ncbi:MAG: hypothetical protein HQ581_04740 [Planctomycetes bacterium]|nr:hypothetical protein [Planctomycetota bacterium]
MSAGLRVSISGSVVLLLWLPGLLLPGANFSDAAWAQDANPFGPAPAAPDAPAGGVDGDDPFGSSSVAPADGDPFGDDKPADPEDPFGDTPDAQNPFGGSGKTEKKDPPPERPEPTEPLRTGTDAILEALQEPTEFMFIEQPLADVADFIEDMHRIPVHIDRRALEDVGISDDTPITFSTSKISLRSALKLTLKPLDLTWIIDAESLVITTDEEAETHLIAKTYDVSDLLVSPLGHPYDGQSLPTTGSKTGGFGGFASSLMFGSGGMGGGSISGGGGMICGVGMPYPSAAPSNGRITMEDLTELLEGIVEPVSWESVGGPGSVRPIGRSLAISQTFDVHERIEELLDQVRAVRQEAPVVVVDAYWLALAPDQLAALCPGRDTKQDAGWRIAVDPKTLAKISAESSSSRGRVTCFSGQKVFLTSGQRRSVAISAIPVVGSGIGYQPVILFPNVGTLLEMRPSVEPGRRTVVLDLKSTVTEWREPGDPIQIGGHSFPSRMSAGAELGGEEVDVPAGTASIAIDRVNLPTRQLATTVRVPLDTPVLVGGLGARPTKETNDPHADAGAGTKPLYLVVEVRLAEK